jgi:hypothetical protein
MTGYLIIKNVKLVVNNKFYSRKIIPSKILRSGINLLPSNSTPESNPIIQLTSQFINTLIL